MNRKLANEDAVSPVVGVMLMLVVTIIIAAVVSGFAGGMASGTEKAPTASITVETGYGYNWYGTELATSTFDICFEHRSGDPLNTADLEIITYLTLPNGTVVKHVQTQNSPYMRESTYKGVVKYARLPFIRDSQKFEACYYSQDDIELGNTSKAWFGEAVWMPGQVARTYKKDATAAFLGLVDEAKIYPADSVAYAAAAGLLEECIQNNCPVEIKIKHVPSGKYILDTTITLQG